MACTWACMTQWLTICADPTELVFHFHLLTITKTKSTSDTDGVVVRLPTCTCFACTMHMYVLYVIDLYRLQVFLT